MKYGISHYNAYVCYLDATTIETSYSESAIVVVC